MSHPDWLGPAARRAAEEAWMLGHVFARYQQLEDRSEAELAAELGCTVDVLHWMSLCRRPSGQALSEQVPAIAKRFEVDALRLLKVIRHVEVLDALSAPLARDLETGEDPVVLAARDRTKDDGTDP